MKIKTLSSLFALLFSFQLIAQNATVTGKITDAATGEPLVGATVRADNNTGSTTDGNGQYALKLPLGRRTITFSYIGFEPRTETVTLILGQSLTLDLKLIDASNLLETATVTSGKFEKPLGQVTVSLDVLKPRLIENTNTTAVDQVLTKVPGVTVVDGQAQIRGGSGFSYGAGTRVLLLVDDMPALQPDAGFPNWNDFPVENISQIEVLKGAASALYGSSAMNGIINIRTGFAKDKPETTVAAWGKIWGTPQDERMAWWKADTSDLAVPYETGFNFVHRRKEGKLDIVLGGFGLKRESYNNATYSEYARLTPNFRYRVNDRLTVGLNSNFNIGRSGSFFVWANDTTGAYLPGLNSASYSKGRVRFFVDPTVQYTDASGNRHKFLGRYYYIHNNNSGNQSNDSRNYYGEYQVQRQFESVGLTTTAGVVGQRSTVKADLYTGDYAANNLAGYFQMDWQPIERLNLSGGLRYERNVQFSPDTIRSFDTELDTIPNGETRESKPVFRFGANYRAGEATYFRASWGQGYRYPTIAEKFISTDFSAGNQVTPNAHLASEFGWTAEIGLKQGFKIGSWKGFADLTAFVSEYERMMEFVLAKLTLDPVTFRPVAFFQSQNIGDTRVVGGEVSVVGFSKLGPGTLSLLAGYTYNDPRYKNFERDGKGSTSDTSTNVLKYRFRHTFKWDSEYEVKKFSLGISVQYNSFMQAVDYIFSPPEGSAFATLAPPFGAVTRFRNKHNNGFTLLDARVAYKLTPTLKIALLGNNLLNQTYALRPALLEAPQNYTLRVEWRI